MFKLIFEEFNIKSIVEEVKFSVCKLPIYDVERKNCLNSDTKNYKNVHLAKHLPHIKPITTNRHLQSS